MIKVLWLCNYMLPEAAEALGRKGSNKEGWISGLAARVLGEGADGGVKLSVAFPVEKELDGWHASIPTASGATLDCYGFYEDMLHPERYDRELEGRLEHIVGAADPDVIHCFGTEFPHTLAMCRVAPRKSRVLVGLQGLCIPIAEAYMADLPVDVARKATFRDLVRRDSLARQQEKFKSRGETETESLKLAENVTGRTPWDRAYTHKVNPEAVYYKMNETLRETFYRGKWEEEKCIPHRIFLSQGDYPLKGLHYMLAALPGILEKYPDTTLAVAGNGLVKPHTLQGNLKISGYGKYLRDLMEQKGLADKVHFLGMLDGEAMKEQYLKSHVFVCPSALENSPNSLGEAMLLGMPCVAACVGGVPGIFTAGVDGIGYKGFDPGKQDGEQLERIASRLKQAVLDIWEDEKKRRTYCENAAAHASETHDGAANYARLLEIYAEIVEK